MKEEFFDDKFIINYVVLDESIIVYYTEEESIIVKHKAFPYTKENESKILYSMKMQFNNWKLVYYECSRVDQVKTSFFSDVSITSLNLMIAILFYNLNRNFGPSATITILYAPRALYNFVKLLVFNKKINNDKKGKVFLKNEELINENIKKKMIELGLVLEGALVPTPNCKINANINDINDLTFSELEDLILYNFGEETLHKLYKPYEN